MYGRVARARIGGTRPVVVVERPVRIWGFMREMIINVDSIVDLSKLFSAKSGTSSPPGTINLHRSVGTTLQVFNSVAVESQTGIGHDTCIRKKESPPGLRLNAARLSAARQPAQDCPPTTKLRETPDTPSSS